MVIGRVPDFELKCQGLNSSSAADWLWELGQFSGPRHSQVRKHNNDQLHVNTHTCSLSVDVPVIVRHSGLCGLLGGGMEGCSTPVRVSGLG